MVRLAEAGGVRTDGRVAKWAKPINNKATTAVMPASNFGFDNRVDSRTAATVRLLLGELGNVTGAATPDEGGGISAVGRGAG